MSGRGFSIAELLVALVVAGIVGVALSKLLINQSRFVATQDNYRQARAGARAALNIPTDELRAVTQSGDSAVVIQADRDSFTVRVPYAYGLVCVHLGGNTHIALFPTDSATYANATPTGYIWRDPSGVLHTVDATLSVSAGTLAKCTSATPPVGVLSTTGWAQTVIAVQPDVTADSVGDVVFLYRRIRYVFANSTQLPGRRALWRVLLPANTRDELVAPFDTSAHFEYLMGDSLIATATPLSTKLDSVEGVRLVLIGASVNNAPGGSKPSTFNLTTNVLFRNRASH